jgi:hypothetical protein
MNVGEKTPTQLGPLERANLNHWTFVLHLSTETDTVSETLGTLEYQTMKKKSQNPVIMCVIHHRQNHLESTNSSVLSNIRDEIYCCERGRTEETH